jgi:hypothetical protein
VNIFDIEKKDSTRDFDGGDTYIEFENDLIKFEYEQKIRKTFFLGENVKILTEMKKSNPNPTIYIKDFNKFPLTFKEKDKQLSLCTLFDLIYEISILNKSYLFLGRFFNG